MMRSALELAGYIELPAHTGRGGFDHAAVHAASGHVFVAHTANDAVDVFDPASGRHIYSVANLPGVAGALVSEECNLVVSSNRGDDSIAMFAPVQGAPVRYVRVGHRPNGLACDPQRKLILVANVGDVEKPGSHTLSMVDIDRGELRHEIEVAGRTRWTVYDPGSGLFYVNIAEPAQIVVVDSRRPDRLAGTFAIPFAGPHGLDFDPATRRLFCACDAGVLAAVDARSGKILADAPLSGVPDVVFFDPHRRRLYIAVGDPGVIDVFDTDTMKRLFVTSTEKGAHTTALAPAGDRLYVFLPHTARAAIFEP